MRDKILKEIFNEFEIEKLYMKISFYKTEAILLYQVKSYFCRGFYEKNIRHTFCFHNSSGLCFKFKI